MTMDQSPRIAVIPSRLLPRMFSDKGCQATGTAFFEARNLSFLSRIAFRFPPHRSATLSYFAPRTSSFFLPTSYFPAGWG